MYSIQGFFMQDEKKYPYVVAVVEIECLFQKSQVCWMIQIPNYGNAKVGTTYCKVYFQLYCFTLTGEYFFAINTT